MIPKKKHLVAKKIADRLNRRTERQCLTAHQQDEWLEKYAQALNVLAEIEHLQTHGIVKIEYI